MQASRVATIEPVVDVAAYNPLTLSGAIVVDDIAASSHSDWFLDGIASPATQAYRTIGPRWTTEIAENWGVVDFVRDGPASPRALALGLAALAGSIGVAVVPRAGAARKA